MSLKHLKGLQGPAAVISQTPAQREIKLRQKTGWFHPHPIEGHVAKNLVGNDFNRSPALERLAGIFHEYAVGRLKPGDLEFERMRRKTRKRRENFLPDDRLVQTFPMKGQAFAPGHAFFPMCQRFIYLSRRGSDLDRVGGLIKAQGQARTVLLALRNIRFFIGKILSVETAGAALDEPLGYC